MDQHHHREVVGIIIIVILVFLLSQLAYSKHDLIKQIKTKNEIKVEIKNDLGHRKD